MNRPQAVVLNLAERYLGPATQETKMVASFCCVTNP